MQQTDSRGKTIQAVDRALEILGLLAEHPKGLGVSSIANSLGLHVSTAHRLLATLAAHNLVRQNEDTSKYRLGLRLIDLGTTVLSGLDLRDEAEPFLDELQRKTGEVVHLAVLDDRHVVYIHKVEPSKGFQIYSRIGRRSPVHCTGLGKAILAFSPAPVVDRVIQAGLHRYTATTICDPDELRAHLGEIRERGFAFDMEEHEVGVCCAAAPVLDYSGRAVAAVSVTGLTVRIGPERLKELGKMVREVADAISERFSFQKQRSHKATQAGD